MDQNKKEEVAILIWLYLVREHGVKELKKSYSGYGLAMVDPFLNYIFVANQLDFVPSIENVGKTAYNLLLIKYGLCLSSQVIIDATRCRWLSMFARQINVPCSLLREFSADIIADIEERRLQKI